MKQSIQTDFFVHAVFLSRGQPFTAVYAAHVAQINNFRAAHSSTPKKTLGIQDYLDQQNLLRRRLAEYNRVQGGFEGSVERCRDFLKK